MRLLHKRLGKPHPYLATLGERFATGDFTERLVPRLPAQASQADTPCAAAVAPSGSFPGGAAFSHFTESCGCYEPQQAATVPVIRGAVATTESCHAAATGQDKIAPVPDAPNSVAGAVALSEASAFILSLIAAHEGRSERDIIAELITAAGYAIGLSPLLARDADDIGDFADLPDFARAAANRFRSA